MDIREAMLELVNSESVRYSYMAIEKIIIVMMRDYLKAQNKRLLAENDVNLQAKCHFFLSKIGTSSTLKTLKIP